MSTSNAANRSGDDNNIDSSSTHPATRAAEACASQHASSPPAVAADASPDTHTVLKNRHAHARNASSSAGLPALDTTSFAYRAGQPRPSPSSVGVGVSGGLSIKTNSAAAPAPGAPAAAPRLADSTPTPTIMYETPAAIPDNHHLASPTNYAAAMGSSLRSNVSTSSLGSAISHGSGSALASPYLATMADLTPLPSPLVGTDSLAMWRSKRGNGTPNRSREGSLDEPAPTGRQPASPDSPSRKRKGYGSLMQEAAIANAQNAGGAPMAANTSAHSRNRSISDFTPEPLHNVRPRHVTMGSGEAPSLESPEYQMQREAYLAEQRGLHAQPTGSTKHLPTPPPSTSSAAGSDDAADEEQPYLEDGTATEYLEIHCGIHNKRRKFRQLRKLGQGTFSTVMLATRERIPAHPTPEIEEYLDPHKLVAVKIVEHGPAGGADAERIEVGLKREVEMLKSISHPSLIHLKACEYQEKRTLLVLTYCPGGDLFDFASQKRDLLTPALIQRMFAELVSAVRYLHVNWIVHRDIKLENVLVNVNESTLRSLEDPFTHPTPIVTLTDLGLSRRIPDPPEPPFLTTRCGSEDYAAPEILLGQPYDGRSTDGWALGVLLYALLEGRLPFDAPPGKPERSRNTHRIARCDWIWCRFGDEDGEWDPSRGAEFEGARPCVEGLLKKVRMGRKNLDEIEALPWVQQGIKVPLRMREEDDDDLL